MKISAFSVQANKGDALEEQVSDCIKQLDEFLSTSSLAWKNIISMNFFLNSDTKEIYLDHTRKINNCLDIQISRKIPVAFLAQPPANSALVSLEIYFINDLDASEVIVKKVDGNLYLVIQRREGEKLVIANGIGKNNGIGSITENAEKVFGVMEKILSSEGMDFSNIFRQWNYIEDIVCVEQDERKSQHYQQFNNVRSNFYSRADFKKGYPAATGIGISAGGVMVSFFAASSEGYHTRAVENPLQTAAFEYSEKVLVGEAEYRGSAKSTPKFSRARFISTYTSKQVFISGTASIREEVTVGEDDIARQTEITLDNIQKLISKETLQDLFENESRLPQIEFFRAYLKYPKDYTAVKGICERRLPSVRGIYVISDMCRDNLLVEIEAVASA